MTGILPSSTFSPNSSSFAIPLNIQADPRVFRGSVYAFLRHQEKAYLRFEAETRKEKKYQLGVMRARLASSLPPLNGTGPKPRSATVLHPPAFHLQSRRSGPLPPLSKPSGTSIDKNFNRVQFVPKSRRTASDLPIKVEPSLTPSTPLGRGGGDPLSSPFRSTSRNAPRLHRISYAYTPPSTRHAPRFAHVQVQTNDDLDESIEKIVAELADSAITLSITNLQLEDETLRLRETIIEKEARLETNELQLRTALQRAASAVQKKEETEFTLRELHDRQQLSRTEALALCRELTQHSISRAQRLENLRLSKRSVAIDTRQFNDHHFKIEQISKELEHDFLPWLIYRAEKTFRRGTTPTSTKDRHKKRRFCRDA
ncbi:hypothetical protein PMAYCL1PPCAC_24600 [Pristionchus mayeri]|uniref:Uncharacterized protein n=1 Tax=Pristionchus mayeri TaxID=1317129 RepID=A0AAN5I7V1_9BILA|nr:hypothetical protein PMAYCL1PPCAC_24600 [Pristionchus mayeri]